MNMIRHKDKRVQYEATFAPVMIKSLEEQSRMRFDHKQSASLPRREGHKIRSRRRDESYRFQEKPQRLKPNVLIQSKSARVELVPFPMLLSEYVSFWESDAVLTRVAQQVLEGKAKS